MKMGTFLMLRSLDHIVVAVRDLERAAESYTSLLGRRPSWRGGHPAYGTANVIFRLENTYLELLAVEREGPVAREVREFLDRSGEGLFALAFGTEDAEALAAALRGRGVEATPAEGQGTERSTGVERRWLSALLPAEATRGVRLFAIEHRSPADRLAAAAPVESPESAVSGCDHVVIQTADAEASSQVYGEILGLRLALDRTFPDWRVRLLFFRVGGVTVELAHALATGAEAGAPDRLWGVSWKVPDLELARERLMRAGVAVSEIRKGRRPGTRVATVHGETHGVATLLLAPDAST